MRVYGVPREGKRVKLFDVVTVQLPYGAVYGTDEKGNPFCGKTKTIPGGYGTNAFSIPDQSEFLWRFRVLSQEIMTLSYDGSSNYFDRDVSAHLKNATERLIKDDTVGKLLGMFSNDIRVRSGASGNGVFVNCTCTENSFIPDRYMPGLFLLGVGSYPDVRACYGMYDAVDIPVYKKEMLPVMNSARLNEAQIKWDRERKKRDQAKSEQAKAELEATVEDMTRTLETQKAQRLDSIEQECKALEAEIPGLEQELLQLRRDLNKLGFFAFSRKSELKGKLAEAEAQQRRKSDRVKDLHEKRMHILDELERPYHKKLTELLREASKEELFYKTKHGEMDEIIGAIAGVLVDEISSDSPIPSRQLQNEVITHAGYVGMQLNNLAAFKVIREIPYVMDVAGGYVLGIKPKPNEPDSPEKPATEKKTATPVLIKPLAENEPEAQLKQNAAPAVESLNFGDGERVRAGEFSILVPGGMCWSGEISPDTRYITSIPVSVGFDNVEWDSASAVKFTVQKGKKISVITEPLNSAAGSARVNSILKNNAVGTACTVASDSEYCICYELASEGEIDYEFHFFIFSRNYVYPGLYIGWKAGLQDPETQHKEILKQLLGAVRYEGTTESELARHTKQALGEYAAGDGKINAVTVAQLFSTDVLFYNEDEFRGTGLPNGLHFNLEKKNEHLRLLENWSYLRPQIVELLRELDAAQELRLPKQKIHKKLLPLLFNDNAVPLTGMTMMNLLAYHMLYVLEKTTDDYEVVIDRNLVAGIPNAYCYTAAFLRRLRLYNGKNRGFSVTFRKAANFDGAIEGVLAPVDGADQTDACRFNVKPDGTVDRAQDAPQQKSSSFDANTGDFDIENGLLKKYNGPGGDVVVPDGVTSIGWAAFRDCKSLTSITLPDGVTSIGYYAFHGCESLTSITLPDSVTSIRWHAFHNCYSLKSVTLPKGVTEIGDRAFWDCMNLTGLVLPESLTSIGAGAFENCKRLTSITLPEGVTDISEGVFVGCKSLTSITLPDGVTSIGERAFDGCESLKSITLPEGVTSIGDWAFAFCKSLTSITLPEGLTEISYEAFKNIKSKITIHAPAGSYAAQYAKENKIRFKATE